MIVLDTRAGSRDLLPYLKTYDVEVETAVLDSADVMFTGCGPDDSLVRVGIEAKTILDLVDSMRTGRLSGHQLNGLCSEYDFAWIMVIGPYRPGEHGELTYLRGRDWRAVSDGARAVLYRAVVSYLASLRLKAGTEAGFPLQIERVNDNREAAALIVGLYQWFAKPWDQHRSHEGVYNKEYRPIQRSIIRRKISQCEQYMAVAPGVDQAAKSVANHFGSMEGLLKATVKEIAACPVEQWLKGGGTRMVRLGEKRAEKIYQSLRSRE